MGCGYKRSTYLQVHVGIILFSLQTYFGIDTSTIEEPVRRRAVETMIKTYGQTPKQLFQGLHPCRMDNELSLLQDGGGSLVAQLIQRGASGRAVMGPETDKVWVSVWERGVVIFLGVHLGRKDTELS